MGRGDRGSIPFNQRVDNGPLAYRTEAEPIDDRPLLLFPQFWTDSMEQRIHEAAVSGNPRRPDEVPWAYIERISGLVTGDPSSPLVKRMPRRGRSQREWERMQNDAKMRAAGIEVKSEHLGGDSTGGRRGRMAGPHGSFRLARGSGPRLEAQVSQLTDAQHNLILHELEELAIRGEYYGNKAQFYKRLGNLIAMLKTGNLYWKPRRRRMTAVRGNKYHARRTPCRQGETHASGAEARRCDELHLMQRGYAIYGLQAHPQPTWPLVVNGVKIGRYTADFSYFEERDGDRRIVEDFKGGPVSRDVPLRLKLMKALYGIDVLLTGRR